jgi:hypothetical protein
MKTNNLFIVESRAAVAAKIVILGLVSTLIVAAGCSGQAQPDSIAKQAPGTADNIDSRSKVVGVPPDAPTGLTQETPGTTSSVKTEMTKAEAATAMPMPMQANDHSARVPPVPNKLKMP